jgi:hypothetical protein
MMTMMTMMTMTMDTIMRRETIMSLARIRMRIMEKELETAAIFKVRVALQNNLPVIQVMAPPVGLEHRVATRIPGRRATNIPLRPMALKASFRLMLKGTRKFDI